MQNAALSTATGCTEDTNIQHLHDETLTLPIHEHLQLHASQYKHNNNIYLKSNVRKYNIHHIPYIQHTHIQHSKATNPLSLTTAATQ